MRRHPSRSILCRGLAWVPVLSAALLADAPAHGQPQAFVANYLGGSVSVIDLRDNRVVETIPGISRAVDVVLSADGRRAFALEGGGALQVIDTATLEIVAAIDLDGTESIEAIVSPDGSRVYVVNAITANIAVVDALSLELDGTIDLPVGGSPTSLAITPAGDRLYVSSFSSRDVLVVDLATFQVVETIPAGAGTNGVTISPDGSRVYAANQDEGTVTVIDPSTDEVVATVAAGEAPRRVVVSPDGARLYVPDLDTGTLLVIDAESLEIVETVAVGPVPTDLSITPDGSTAYVVVSGANRISAVDTASAEVVATIEVGSSPFGISNFLSCGGGNLLCLTNDRFRVNVAFRTDDGPLTPAEFEQLTDETGYFWFFSRSNVELVVKVLNACEVYGRFWVFAAGLTDVEVEITITDTATGETRGYRNPPKTAFQPIQDTDAFATCP